jgi:hypothetical protein
MSYGSSTAFTVTRDVTSPTLTLQAIVQGSDVPVTWSAVDPSAGSGVDASTCLLEVREDEGAWQPFSTACGGDDTYHSQPGHAYTFLSATDNACAEPRPELVEGPVEASATPPASKWRPPSRTSHRGVVTVPLRQRAPPRHLRERHSGELLRALWILRALRRDALSSAHFSASVVPAAFGRAQSGRATWAGLAGGGATPTVSARPLHLLCTCGIL